MQRDLWSAAGSDTALDREEQTSENINGLAPIQSGVVAAALLCECQEARRNLRERGFICVASIDRSST
jgi:hypothetical protein